MWCVSGLWPFITNKYILFFLLSSRGYNADEHHLLQWLAHATKAFNYVRQHRVIDYRLSPRLLFTASRGCLDTSSDSGCPRTQRKQGYILFTGTTVKRVVWLAWQRICFNEFMRQSFLITSTKEWLKSVYRENKFVLVFFPDSQRCNNHSCMKKMPKLRRSSISLLQSCVYNDNDYETYSMGESLKHATD